MSRSIKKYGIVKDKGLSRGLYNRRFRRVNRQRVRLGREPFLMREVVKTMRSVTIFCLGPSLWIQKKVLAKSSENTWLEIDVFTLGNSCVG